jgi:hypothetical protein
MNLYGQILSVTLGGLLSISEILPFVRNVKTNGILHFLLSSLIKDKIEYEIQNDDESILSSTRSDIEHSQDQESLPLDLESQPLLHSNKRKSKKETQDDPDLCSGLSRPLFGSVQDRETERQDGWFFHKKYSINCICITHP